jgi:hypothetical protein
MEMLAALGVKGPELEAGLGGHVGSALGGPDFLPLLAGSLARSSSSSGGGSGGGGLDGEKEKERRQRGLFCSTTELFSSPAAFE